MPARDVLNEHAGPPVDGGAESLLIDGADGNADEAYRCRRPGERRGGAGARPILHHQINADNAEHEAEPLPRHDRLPEQTIGDRRRQYRLQPNDQGRERRGQSLPNGDIDAAEIENMHEHAGHAAVDDAGRIRPFRPRLQQNEAEEHDCPDHAQRQEGQRLRVGQTELGADKARGPQHHEEPGRRKDCGFFDGARHWQASRRVSGPAAYPRGERRGQVTRGPRRGRGLVESHERLISDIRERRISYFWIATSTADLWCASLKFWARKRLDDDAR